jgi:heat shock protein HslJ
MDNNRPWYVARALRLSALVLVGALAAMLAARVAAQTVPVQMPSPRPAPEPAGDPTQGTWQWVRTEYGDDSIVVALDPGRYTIAFGPDGRLAIRADCNQVVGTYTLQGPALTPRLGPGTLVGCPPDSQADVFVRDLGAVATYVFSGENLVLNMRLDTGNMIFEQQPAALLAETNWHVQSYNNGLAGVTSPLPQTQLTANFGSDGTVTGRAGCNTYRGSYTVEGGALSFGPLATTRMACPAPTMEQERAFLAALQATSQFSLTAERLTLRDGNGSTQVVFIAVT